MRPKLEKSDFTLRKSHEDRQRRSLQDYISDYTVLTENLNNEDEVQKILANAKAQLSTVKSENMGTFRNNAFGDDWLSFVLPFRSGMGFTESLLRTLNASYDLGIQNWNENEKWIDDTKFLNTKQFLQQNEDMEIDEKDGFGKKYGSFLSNEGRNTGYSDELTKTSWITEQAEDRHKIQHPESPVKEASKDGSGITEEKYETDAGSPMKDAGKDGSGRTEEKYKEAFGSRLEEAGEYGSDTQPNKEHLIKNDEHRNKYVNYGDMKVNVDIKNEETLFDDISIDNTMNSVVGSDKLSTAELPVKILQAHDKTNRNKRPSSDKSLFISDPFVLRTKWEDDSRQEKKDKESKIVDESSSMKVDQNMQGGKLISNEIQDESHQNVKSSLQDGKLINKETQESYRDSTFPNDESDFNESVDILRARNKMDEKMISMEKEKSIVTTQEKKDSSELKIPQLLDESSDLREQMQRRQSLYQGNEKNLPLNSWRIDGSPATDTRKGIQQEYDKQKSAAETSIRVDANKRGRVKHRERIGTKSTSTEEMHAENEERRESLDRDGQQSEMEGRNVSSADRADYTVDSDENVKLERTPLEEREEAIADVKSREEKSDVGNLKEKKHEAEAPETAEFEFDVNSNEFEIESLKNTEFKMKYLRGKYSTEENLRMQKSELRNKGDVEGDDINRGKFGLEDVEKEESKEESNKKKEHDISGTKKTKFEVENSQGKKLRLQDVNEGDKLESKGLKRKKFDPEISTKRKFEAASSQIGNVKLNFGQWDVAGQKFESEDLQKRKSEERNVDNDKFEAGDLKEQEVGPEYEGETEYDPIVTQENKSGSMNVETEKFKPPVEVFKPQFREDNLLLTSDEDSTKNDKNIEQFAPRDTQINIKQGKKIVQQDKESSETENDEFNKNVGGINKKLEEDIKGHETDEHLIVKVKDDEIFKEDPWNNDVTYKYEDLHATHDDAFEISNKEIESRKKEHEITSGKQSLNVDEERGITENKSKENEQVISYERAIYKDTSADKASGGIYKLKEDHIVTNKRKYEADMTKGIGLSSVEEGTNETSSKNEEEREKLSLSKEILGKRDFKIKSDTSEDNDKKDVKSNQIFDENASSMEENNVLVKRTQLQADRTLSGITDIAEEGPFVNAGIHEKNNRARVLSAKTNTKEKEPFNDPRIYQEIHNTEPLGNNEKHIIRTKENKPNKLSENQTDRIKTLNIENNQFSNDNIIISKKDNSANKINEILQEYENSEKTLLRDSEVNQATNLSSISTATGSPTDPQGNDESSTATIEARVAKLQNENEELRPSGNDTSTTPDEDRIEIRANFGELNNIDVHALGYSDRLKKDNNPSPAVHEVSLEENEPGKDKVATFGGVSSENTQEEAKEGKKEITEGLLISNSSASSGEESKTAKETHVIGGTKEKYETQAANEIDNTLETLNETADQSVIDLTGFLSDKSKESSSKERPEEIGSVFYNSNEESNFSDVHITNPPVFIDKTDHETIDPDESSQKYIKSDRESTNAALTKVENLEKEYYAKKETDEASKLNSNIDTSTESLIKTKELDVLGKQKDKVVANDVNLEQATESFSAWSSKFSGNSGISGEDNISSTAINQGSEEETEKEEITGRNTAEDHSSKHSDLKMISNLSVISSGSTEIGEENEERNSTITDGKVDSGIGHWTGNLSNVARLLTSKNSAEIMNYYKTEGNGSNFVEYEKINKSDKGDRTKESEIDISERSNESSIGITQKQAATTGKSRLNDPYAKETEQKASLNESESITWDLNKEKAPVQRSNTSIEVTKSNDAARESKESSPTANTLKMSKNKVLLSDLSIESSQKNDKLEKKQHETSNNSSSGKTRSKEDEITKLRTKVNDKYTAPSAERQLIENEVLGAFSETSTQPALNISEARSPDMHENTIKSRLLEAATLRPLNWTDNEGYKDPLVEASRLHKETLSTGTYDPDTMHLSKLDPEKKLSEIVKVSNEKVKSSTGKVENIPKEGGYDITYNNMKRLGGDEEEKVAENIFNEFNDISVESNNEHMGTIEDNKFMNSIADTSYASVSLNESDYRIDGEVNAKRQENMDLSYENDLLGARQNENIKNTDILDQKHDLNEKYSELDVNDEDYEPKILTIIEATQDHDNLLKNSKQEANPLLKLLLNKANDIKNLNNEIKGSHMSDNSSEKNNESSGARTKIKLDEQNTETSEGKATQESESYEDKLHLSEQRISQSEENLYEISEDGKETQIQKALTEAEIAVTELPRVKEQQQKNILEKEEETYTKAVDKHISSENHLEDPDRRNVSWNQLNPMEITDSKSNDEISLKEHYKPKIQVTSSNLEDIDSEILIKSDSKPNTIMNDLRNKYKDLALDINDPQKMTYDSNIQDESKLNSKEVGHSGTSIKSYTSNVTENNIHNQYQNTTLAVTEPLKLDYQSKIQKLRPNSENDTNSSVSIGSGYTSNAIESDLHDTLKDPAMSVSNPKKVIYESYAQDESGLNSRISIGSGYASNAIASDLHHTLKDPAMSVNNSKKVINESYAQNESELNSKISIGSGYASNAIASDLHDILTDPAMNVTNPKKVIYESYAQDESGLSSGVSVGSGNTSNAIASDLHDTLKDPAMSVNNSNKVIYESYAQDESGLNSRISIGSGYASNAIASDLHHTLNDPAMSVNNSKKVINESYAQNESELNSRISIGSGYTSNAIAIDLHDILKDPTMSVNNSNKVINESYAQNESELNSRLSIGSGYTSNAIASDLHDILADPAMSVNNPKKVIYESYAQDESGLSSGVSIGSGNTSNAIAIDLHDILKDPAMSVNNSNKVINESYAQNESGLNSSVSIGSGYTSNAVVSDLHDTLRDPAMSVSNSKKVIHESYAQDEPGLNSGVSIGSGNTINAIEIDLHDILTDPAMNVNNSKKVIHESYAQDESGLNFSVSIGSGNTSNAIASDLHDTLKDPAMSVNNSNKVINESYAQNESELNSRILIGSGYASNAIASDLHHTLKDPAMSVNNSKKVINESYAQNESGLSSGVSIGSGYTSNAIESDLHDILTDPVMNVNNPKKVIYESYAQDESGLSSGVSIGSGYTSNAIASDLDDILRDPVMSVSNSKKVIHESYAQDESGLNSSVSFGSGYISNAIAIDLHDILTDPTMNVNNSKKIIYESYVQDESELNSSVSIGSGYTSNAIANDLLNTLRDSATSVNNSKKVIYESYAQDESGLNSKEKANPDISAESRYTSNVVKSDSHNISKNPAISTSDSKEVSYGSKVKDKSKFTLEEDAYSDISVKSSYTSNANMYNLHNDYQEPTLIVYDPVKMTYGSNIQDESKLDSKEKTEFGISGESPYASGVDKNDLHNENQNLTLVVSDPKTLTYKSNIYDETKPKLKGDLTRKLDSNEEADSIMSTEPYSDLPSESNDSSISVSDELAEVLYKSNIDNKSTFDSKKDADSGLSVTSYSIWNTINSGLHNRSKDSATTLNDSKKIIHESSVEDNLRTKSKDSAITLNDSKKVIHESSVEDNSKENIDTDIPVESYFTSNVEHDLHSQYQDPELVVLEPPRINHESKMSKHSIHDKKEDTDSDISNKSQYTSSTVNSNLHNEFRDPAQTDSKKSTERHNLKTIANSENIVENESTQFIKDGKTLPISEIHDQSSLFTIVEEGPEANTRGVNVLSDIPVIGASTDAHRSLEKKEKSTKSNNLLSHVSGTILSGRDSEEIPDAKFVKELQPSSEKLAKSWAEIVNKSESSSPVSSKKFKSHSDEAESATSVKSSSYKTLDKVLEAEDANNNLCDILRSSFLFTHFEDDAWDNEVSSTYDDVSTDVLPSNVANVKNKSYESASMLQVSTAEEANTLDDFHYSKFQNKFYVISQLRFFGHFEASCIFLTLNISSSLGKI